MPGFKDLITIKLVDDTLWMINSVFRQNDLKVLEFGINLVNYFLQIA